MIGLIMAAAVAASPAPQVITNPDWERLPSGGDMARYYPLEAQWRGIEGRAVISCTVSVSGGLANCGVVSEDPPGAGFGEAALRLSTIFKMRPKLEDGSPVEGGSVRIPIRFKLAGPVAPAWLSTRPSAVPAWSILVPVAPLLALLIAAAFDLWAKPPGARMNPIAVAGRAVLLAAKACLTAPGPLILYGLAVTMIGAARFTPPVERTVCLLIGLPLIIVAWLMSMGAVYRIGFRRLHPRDRWFFSGFLGLKIGQIEGRILTSSLLLAMVSVLILAGLAAGIGAIVWGVDQLAPIIDLGPVAVGFQGLAAAVGGAAPLGLFAAFSVGILISSRWMIFVPQAALDQALDLAQAWKALRGSWLTATLLQLVVLAATLGTPYAGAAVGYWLLRQFEVADYARPFLLFAPDAAFRTMLVALSAGVAISLLLGTRKTHPELAKGRAKSG